MNTSSLHRGDHTPENTGDFSFVGKVGEIYLEISGTSKQSAWNEFQTRIRKNLSSWSKKEVSELNNLPGVQSPFATKLEVTNGYFTENDWNNLEKWYIENRGTGDNKSILKNKFGEYKNKYINEIQTFFISEYKQVLDILIQRTKEPKSGKIGEHSQQLLNEIVSMFPKEVTQLLKIKAIQDAHVKTTKRTLRFEDDAGPMKSIKERVQNALKWGSKSIKNLKTQKRRVLGILLLGSALVGGGYTLKHGKIGSIESLSREENDTLVLSSTGFSQMIHHQDPIPWEIFTDSTLMDTIRLGCDTFEQNWWEKILSFTKEYDVQNYQIEPHCNIKAIRGLNPEKIRLAFQITQTKQSENTINVSISEFRELFRDEYTKKIITTLPKLEHIEDISIEQIHSILNAAKSIKTLKRNNQGTISLIQELIHNNLDRTTIISEDSWSQVIGKHEDYDKKKSIEKFEELGTILKTNGFILTINTIPNLDWPKLLKGEALMRNPLFQIGINGIVENFVSKNIQNPTQEITEAIQLLLESESNLDPRIKNKTDTSASGMFQILKSHMHTFGWGDKKITDMNPIEQARLFNTFIDKKFEYNADKIKTHMHTLGAFAGWMGSAHINNRWASEPRLRASGFDNFPQYLSKQEERMEQSSFQFSDKFKERIRGAKITLQRVLEHTKNIPQSMETPTASEEAKGILRYLNTTWLNKLSPTSGMFVTRSIGDRRTQIGGTGPGREHYGVDLISNDVDTSLHSILLPNATFKLDINLGGYGNTHVEAIKLSNGGYLIALVGHLEYSNNGLQMGSTGSSTGKHFHIELYIVDSNNKGYRIGPAWSGVETIDWKDSGRYVKNAFDKENAFLFCNTILPQVREYFQK